jgi:hypothetical protein
MRLEGPAATAYRAAGGVNMPTAKDLRPQDQLAQPRSPRTSGAIRTELLDIDRAIKTWSRSWMRRQAPFGT